MTPKDNLLDLARKELGTVEEPAGSNNTKYGAAYGLQGQPWCVIFLWWLFREAGLSPLFYDGSRTASCGTLLRWARTAGLTVPTEAAQPGDIVILNFHGTQDTEHCGLVEAVLTVGSVSTIEGNTTTGATGSQDNGGIVARKTRYTHQIVGVIRPRYQTMDYVGHWYEDDVRWGIEAGLLRGLEDGSYRADRQITVAETVALLRRYDERIRGKA